MINGRRDTLEDNRQKSMRKRDCSRYLTETDRDMVMVDTTANADIAN